MAELLKAQKQKIVIDKVIKDLSQSDPNLYYTDSNTIAAMIYHKIKDGALSKQDQELFEGLNENDILILMSYKNS